MKTVFTNGCFDILHRGHLDYLKETDWYVTRKADAGTAIPDDITAARALARSSIVEVV